MAKRSMHESLSGRITSISPRLDYVSYFTLIRPSWSSGSPSNPFTGRLSRDQFLHREVARHEYRRWGLKQQMITLLSKLSVTLHQVAVPTDAGEK